MAWKFCFYHYVIIKKVINIYRKECCILLGMKCKKSSFVWIILSMIILLTGMCSRIERTDSFLALPKQTAETDAICDVKNDTLYIGNCTNKLITGLRNTFQKSRRGHGRLSLRNYAEFLWLKEILQMLCSFCIAAIVTCLIIQSSNVAILEFIHDQDGEK